MNEQNYSSKENSNNFKKLDTFHEMETACARLSVLYDSHKAQYISGSCFRIARNLYLSSKHVFDEYANKFGLNGNYLNFDVWVTHIVGKPKYAVYTIDELYVCPYTDIVLFHTKPYNKDAAEEANHAGFKLELVPPKVGESIQGFGHHSPVSELTIDADDTRHFLMNVEGAISSGVVQQVFHEYRDRSGIPFPSFEVNAKFKHSMSGGPVFNENGMVCGVICRGWNTAEDMEPIEYVASLWPIMATEVPYDANGKRSTEKNTLLELAKNNIISANNWDMISFRGRRDKCGTLIAQIKKY